MHATALSGRTLQCACCHTEVLVCVDCERGQRYCSDECRKQARLASQRRASRVYQSSRVGRCNHARRQGRLRTRQRQRQRQRQPEPELIPKNSDSSGPSQEACAGDLLGPRLDVRPQAASKPTPAWHCHWCARPVASGIRHRWLLRATSEQMFEP
jgi:hypothetical protein